MADPATPTCRWSRETYDRAVEAGIFGPGDRVELIDGEILTLTPQGSRHAAVATRAAGLLARAFGSGCHVRTRMPLATGGDSEPEPDVAVVEGDEFDYLDAHPATADRPKRPRSGYSRGPYVRLKPLRLFVTVNEPSRRAATWIEWDGPMWMVRPFGAGVPSSRLAMNCSGELCASPPGIE